MRKLLIYYVALATSSLSGCAIYKIDIPQGNLIEAEEAAELRPGLTRRQVEFLLGTPAVTDPFHPDRWDYVYFFKPGRGEPERRALSVIFQGDQVARIEGEIPAPKTVKEDLEELTGEEGRGDAAEEDLREPPGRSDIFGEPLD
jgi:outer membrane protein assembly factor BamE